VIGLLQIVDNLRQRGNTERVHECFNS